MRKSGIMMAAPALLIGLRTGGSPVSGAWMVFFALSLKRSGGWIGSPADYRKACSQVQNSSRWIALRRASCRFIVPLAGAETALFH